MIPLNANTQNHSYVRHEHPKLSLLTPTELDHLHSDPNKCYSQMTFVEKLFPENM
jgi:hypothetical protein